MPLIHGKSGKAFEHNMKAEMHAGKPQKQSLAIAYSIKRKAQHKAHGGKLHSGDPIVDMQMAEGGHVHGPECAEGCMMSEGGKIKEKPIKGHGRLGVEFDPTLPEREGYPKTAKEQQERLMAELARTNERQRRKPEKMAEGGEVMDGEQDADHELDMVGRIMKQRKMMSEGGKVANDTHPFAYEFEEPNEYDDLVRRDDLEQHDTGENSGDELGNERLDHDEHDIVMRIMKSRRMKDRMPRPA